MCVAYLIGAGLHFHDGSRHPATFQRAAGAFRRQCALPTWGFPQTTQTPAPRVADHPTTLSVPCETRYQP
jgi:hypothetical protein